jgi:hypothetical protein
MKDKIEFTLEQAMKVQRGENIYLYFLTLAIDKLCGQRHAAFGLPQGKKPAEFVEEVV